jgi:hypothetical protein
VGIERGLNRVELCAVALRLVRRRDRGEHPERGAHVVVLGAERLGRALLAARLFVQREEPLLLVAEVLENRLAQRTHGGRQHCPVAGCGGVLRRLEQRLAVAVVCGERPGSGDDHAPIVEAPRAATLI